MFKNFTFPTDVKLVKKVINICNKIASNVHVTQQQTYKKQSK